MPSEADNVSFSPHWRLLFALQALEHRFQMAVREGNPKSPQEDDGSDAVAPANPASSKKDLPDGDAKGSDGQMWIDSFVASGGAEALLQVATGELDGKPAKGMHSCVQMLLECANASSNAASLPQAGAADAHQYDIAGAPKLVRRAS